MYLLSQIQKQQVGLRLPKYLIEEIDEFAKEYNVNRSDIITESIRAYIAEQKTAIFYQNIDKASKETKDMIDGKIKEKALQELLNEL